MSGNDEEKMVLGHDPVPGYRPAFFIIFILSTLYLLLLFLKSM